MPTGGRDEDSPWGSVLGKGSERGTVFEIAEGDQARHTLLGNQKPKLLEGVRPFQERRHYEVMVSARHALPPAPRRRRAK